MTMIPEANSEGVPLRMEDRQHVVHVVDYSTYPRRDASENRCVAYTQDRSESGLGLDLPERVSPGELLRVTVRDIDGEVALDGLARVVWCKESEGGRARAGVSVLQQKGSRRMARVQPGGVIATRTKTNIHALGSS
jgi:hypothetical protein